MRRGNRAMHGSVGTIGNVAGLGSSPGRHSNSGRVRSRTSTASREARVASSALSGTPSSSPANQNQGFSISRRHLIAGAAGIGVIAALGGGAAFVTSQNSQQEDLVTLEVPESAVTSSDDLGDAVPAEEHMTLTGRFDLAYGTQIWASDDQVAACLVPGETANPLCQVGILSLSTGNLTMVLEAATSAAEGFQIYDARATSQGLVWIEADILENAWRVYAARLSSDGTLGAVQLLDEGGGDWETPSIAAVDDKAFWQVMPKLDTDASTEDSLVKMASFGDGEAQTVYTSSGRLATPPYAADSGVVITPRVGESGVYYQLTLLDAETGQTSETMVLPQGMSPLEAGYGANGFMFTFDAIYNYGGGIANLGTYCPAQDAQGSDYSAVPWFRFARTPSAAPAWCGDYLMVKSTTSVCGVDIASGLWFSLGVENGTDDYGDYLASTGDRSTIVTYSNIDHTPLGGERIHCCRVSVWTPMA